MQFAGIKTYLKIINYKPALHEASFWLLSGVTQFDALSGTQTELRHMKWSLLPDSTDGQTLHKNAGTKASGCTCAVNDRWCHALAGQSAALDFSACLRTEAVHTGSVVLCQDWKGGAWKIVIRVHSTYSGSLATLQNQMPYALVRQRSCVLKQKKFRRKCHFVTFNSQ